ncbi:MAG TPA: hypothetical protein VGQ83_16050 [Polyangia bacterium]|jgi:hypothetical protein
MFLEPFARALVIAHAVAAAALCGAATHLAVSLVGRLRGRAAWGREQRVALWAGVAYLVTFGLGLLVYPTYRVRVRAEYLDAGRVVRAEAQARAAVRTELTRAPAAAPPAAPLGGVAHVFDIKEHWAALGLPAAVALLVLRRRAGPDGERRLLPLYAGLAVAVALIAYTGALIGLVTASHRALGVAG